MGTIDLTRALPDLMASVTIQGPGASLVTVRRNTGGNYRIFTVAADVNVVISGLTIANGRAAQGGGIYVAGGALTLTDSILSNNQAVGADGANGGLGQPGGNGEPGIGGGIYVAGGAVEVTSSTLTTNQSIGGRGGK
jgi:hypothetical protein